MGGSPQKRPAETVGSTEEGFPLEDATLSGQLPVFLQEPHQDGVGMGEVGELALKLIGPFLAVEELVAKPPNDHHHGEKLIARIVAAAVEN
ncbi:hypothetical protein [Xanthomonas phaseoli]|uniref:hypothetical protein n=1 Tax=Xanthomonas phaseoli TaxID=1985254 RepID=UPI001E30DA06|nr:hypothetical protein [Xanthomonas phaseoli]MCC8469311.1 hypothetical protein [Xanthomonas phaseoli]